MCLCGGIWRRVHIIGTPEVREHELAILGAGLWHGPYSVPGSMTCIFLEELVIYLPLHPPHPWGVLCISFCRSLALTPFWLGLSFFLPMVVGLSHFLLFTPWQAVYLLKFIFFSILFDSLTHFGADCVCNSLLIFRLPLWSLSSFSLFLPLYSWHCFLPLYSLCYSLSSPSYLLLSSFFYCLTFTQ